MATQPATDTDFSLDPAALLAEREGGGKQLEGMGPWQLAWRRLKRNRVAMVSLVVFFLLVACCIAAPLYADHIAGRGPTETNATGTIMVDGKKTFVVTPDGTPIGPGLRKQYLLGADPHRAARSAAAGAADAVDKAPDDAQVQLSFGDTDLGEYLYQLAADHLIHGWDLAMAIGGATALDPEAVDEVASWFREREELYRGGGAIFSAEPIRRFWIACRLFSAIRRSRISTPLSLARIWPAWCA